MGNRVLKHGATWIISLIILVALGFHLREHLDFLPRAWDQLRQARVPWLLMAMVSALVSMIAMAEVMRLLLRAGKTSLSLARATGLTLASHACSTTLPAGPALSGIMIFNWHRRWGAHAELSAWFLALSWVISTAWLIILGLISFLGGAQVSGWALATSTALILAVLIALYVSRSFFEKLRSIRTTPRIFLRATSYSLLNRLSDAAIVLCASQAIEAEISLSTVALAYLAAKLAGSVQITPLGIGTTEAAMVAVLVAGGVGVVDATAVTIIYRTISVGLLSIVGWAAYVALRYKA